MPEVSDGQVRAASCPACGDHVAVSFFYGGQQPLATIAWPRGPEAARNLERFCLDFVRCLGCGHVFNASFDYENVPYSAKPNLMFNKGAAWAEFIGTVRHRIVQHLRVKPVVVEIGYGDGSFLTSLAGVLPNGRFVGFDPNGQRVRSDNVECRRELFDANVHLSELMPNVIVTRHVLEHMANPLGFLQLISAVSALLGTTTLCYFEVPCIDIVFSSRRTVDFYYEHGSQFTTASFTRMLGRSGGEILEIGHGYGGEIVFGFVRLGSSPLPRVLVDESLAFFAGAEDAKIAIGGQLAELHASGASIAIWGGTGKSAAFMCRYGVDAERFPVVVDSDREKCGTFVPGTGQEIRFRDWLLTQPAQIIIVPPQWRAADIILEMITAGITIGAILIEHGGRLIDYFRDEHPYRGLYDETRRLFLDKL